ncbi:extracellular solute-binding protein [Paraburkholderia sp. 1N]|uniref:Extracellular solute-binding protein n=1 Tax=Paraburkholderia solitsugae TaxID=2675748 RepID=A0ABX2BU02_9BURK|nr:extracellular solute-binding protein [Paraburkholderia solitsugae]NPT43480.1 extracellular solute-binding protein [Paraburkholderia solitsugae]
MDRRKFLSSSAGIALAATAGMASGIGSARAATKELRLLTWEGYADQVWVSEFEKAHNVSVKVSYTGSVDEIFAKMLATKGGDYDVIAIETSSYKRLVQQKLLQPLNLGLLPNRMNLSPAFTGVQSIVFNGGTYAAPFAWGSIPLIYDRKVFSKAPTSWSVFWDKKYAGRMIAMDDATNAIVTTALLLHVKDPFNMTAADFSAVKEKLLEQKKNVLTYYAGFDDGVSIMAQGGVDFMMSMGEPQVQMLQKKGVDAALCIPNEGAIGWIDCWTVSAGARDTNLAHAWINFMMDKRIGRYISEKTGYGNTTDIAANEKIGLTYADRLVFLQAPEDQGKRINLWNEIKATPVT